jgi:hypothetical protein
VFHSKNYRAILLNQAAKLIKETPSNSNDVGFRTSLSSIQPPLRLPLFPAEKSSMNRLEVSFGLVSLAADRKEP